MKILLALIFVVVGLLCAQAVSAQAIAAKKPNNRSDHNVPKPPKPPKPPHPQHPHNPKPGNGPKDPKPGNGPKVNHPVFVKTPCKFPTPPKNVVAVAWPSTPAGKKPK